MDYKTSHRQIVVIGGGIAGLTAAQAARQTDDKAEISLICGENRPPYFRTRLGQCISGQMDEERLSIHGDDWFAEWRIRLVYGRVSAVAREMRQVRIITASGENESLPYDRLVLACGGRGNLPNFDGNDRDNVVVLRTIDDLAALRRFPGPAVVIGDGPEAVEVAYHLSQAGRDVTIVGRNKHLLHRVVDREASVFFLTQTTHAGVRVALNGTVELFDGSRAVLGDSRCFEASLVVAAAGFRSVTNLMPSLIEEAGHGIPVNEYMRTTQEDIYACGDCAEFNGLRAGRWSIAMAQGKVAGSNAASAQDSAIYRPSSSEFMLDAMSSQLWVYGDINAPLSESRRNPAEGLFAKMFFAVDPHSGEERLVGAELIGDCSNKLQLKKAIDDAIGAEQTTELWPSGLQ